MIFSPRFEVELGVKGKDPIKAARRDAESFGEERYRFPGNIAELILRILHKRDDVAVFFPVLLYDFFEDISHTISLLMGKILYSIHTDFFKPFYAGHAESLDGRIREPIYSKIVAFLLFPNGPDHIMVFFNLPYGNCFDQ